MKIIIDYESSWRNSFLEDMKENQDSKSIRKYIASSKVLSQSDDNFKKRVIEKSTVMGILSRLIGDQRKLYQARSEIYGDYYFKSMEDNITFRDDSSNWDELVYLRNMNNSEDPTSYTGIINENHPLLTSNYSSELWSTLFYEAKDLVHFILGNNSLYKLKNIELSPFAIVNRINEFKDIKLEKISEKENLNPDDIEKVNVCFKNKKLNLLLQTKFPKLRKSFSEIEYIKKEKVVVRALYCSALYLQALKLSDKYEMNNITLKGFSVNGFTPKDFMGLFTGGKKKVYGNPYKRASRFNGDEPLMLTKARGKLEINIGVERTKGKEIKNMIECAGVSSFYLGKKGLAYVSKIHI
jgi:hypothetical protein